MAPAYINGFIDVRKHTRFTLLSNSGTILLNPARKMKNLLAIDPLV